MSKVGQTMGVIGLNETLSPDVCGWGDRFTPNWMHCPSWLSPYSFRRNDRSCHTALSVHDQCPLEPESRLLSTEAFAFQRERLRNNTSHVMYYIWYRNIQDFVGQKTNEKWCCSLTACNPDQLKEGAFPQQLNKFNSQKWLLSTLDRFLCCVCITMQMCLWLSWMSAWMLQNRSRFLSWKSCVLRSSARKKLSIFQQIRDKTKGWVSFQHKYITEMSVWVWSPWPSGFRSITECSAKAWMTDVPFEDSSRPFEKPRTQTLTMLSRRASTRKSARFSWLPSFYFSEFISDQGSPFRFSIAGKKFGSLLRTWSLFPNPRESREIYSSLKHILSCIKRYKNSLRSLKYLLAVVVKANLSTPVNCSGLWGQEMKSIRIDDLYSILRTQPFSSCGNKTF